MHNVEYGIMVQRNGTVLLMCSRAAGPDATDDLDRVHWRLYRASSPRGPWSHVTEVYPTSNRTGPQSEDPFIWEDKHGNLHALSHTFPPVGPNGGAEPSTVVSMHGFSRDGITWNWSGDQPYDSESLGLTFGLHFAPTLPTNSERACRHHPLSKRQHRAARDG